MTKRDGDEWVRSTPGIYAANKDLIDIITDLKDQGRSSVYLHESGDDITTTTIPENAFIVLGDQHDLTEEEESQLDTELGRISLGPEVLHTDHCIVLIHNALDRSVK